MTDKTQHCPGCEQSAREIERLREERAALRRPRALHARLYFDGDQLRWLARPLPGWMRVAVPVRLLIDLDEAA